MQRCDILKQENEQVSAQAGKLRTDLSTQTRKVNDAEKLIQRQKPQLERLRKLQRHFQEAQRRFVVTRDPGSINHAHVMHTYM